MTEQARLTFPEWLDVDRPAFDAALSALISAFQPGTYFVWARYSRRVVSFADGYVALKSRCDDAFLTHVYNCYHPGAGHIKVGEVTITDDVQ